MRADITLRAKLLIAMAVGVAGYVVFMPDASQTIEPARGAGSGAVAATRPAARPGHAVPAGRDPSMRDEVFRQTGRIAADTEAASLFSPHSWFVAPPSPPPPPAVAYQPPPPPTAPPLPFAFMGSYKAEDGASIYFLTAGDRVFDVRIGDTLDRTYSVDAVQSGQMMLTYMPLKIQQSLAVGDQ
jgi:hypothetical protein